MSLEAAPKQQNQQICSDRGALFAESEMHSFEDGEGRGAAPARVYRYSEPGGLLLPCSLGGEYDAAQLPYVSLKSGITHLELREVTDT